MYILCGYCSEETVKYCVTNALIHTNVLTVLCKIMELNPVRNVLERVFYFASCTGLLE